MGVQVAMDKVPVILVGNKIDLSDGSLTAASLLLSFQDRAITTEEGRDMALKLGIPESFFFEASAKTFFHVKEVFEKITAQCVQNWQKDHVATGGSSHHHHHHRRCLLL